MAFSTDGQTIAFRSWHGKWLCAEPSGVVVCNRPTVRGWEEFEIHSVSDRQVAIRSRAHNRYLCAEPDGGVVCNRTQVRGWERWSPFQAGDRTGFLSHHRGMLGVLPNGHVHAVAPHFLEWESLEMFQVIHRQENEGLPSGFTLLGSVGRLIRGLLKSDPIGQDPGEDPNFVGREHLQVAEAIAERIRNRYRTRFEQQPPGLEIEPEDRERTEREFERMDRGNYELERRDRLERTA